MRIVIFVWGVLIFSLTGVVFADVWTDPFDGTELAEGWEFRDHNAKKTTFEVKDGFLQMTNPGNWGHTTPDKPMLEREVPKSAAKNITVSGIFTTEPDKPADAWIGIFLYSDEDLNYACFLFGGEANQPQKTLIGSMVQANWQDKGHFQTGFDVPLHLKIVKEDDVFSGYYRENEKDEWTLSGDKTWNHKFDVERVGIGFMNNWGGQTVTFLVDTLSIDGEGIEPFAVEPEGKLATAWGNLKTNQ